jgi:hypothetical protein
MTREFVKYRSRGLSYMIVSVMGDIGKEQRKTVYIKGMSSKIVVRLGRMEHFPIITAGVLREYRPKGEMRFLEHSRDGETRINIFII